jgi:hypothetical protein
MGKKTAKQNASLNKRWFANMDGWGVSFQVGSGEPQKGRRSLPASIEQKFSAANVYVIGATQGTLYTYNPLANLLAGTGSGQRVGDGIKLKGISLKMDVVSAASTPSNWRFLVVASTAKYSGTNFGSGIGTTDLFFGALTGVSNHVDSRRAKVLCDTIVEAKPRVTGQSDICSLSIDCELNVPFAYQTGSVYGESANIYVVVYATTPNGTTGTTVCGTAGGELLVSWAD